jgi:hypothetical protein
LKTNTGQTGYRITKLQLIGNAPGTEVVEAVVKIYKISQDTVDGAVDLSDNTLVGVGFYVSGTDEEWSIHNILIFDNEIFNQDIYITHYDAVAHAGQPVNYYIELEQVKLDLNESTVATLKDIRNNTE